MRYTNINNEVKNMRIGDKGQGAMEYLMTYGWAILVVMIVGVVLWQLGVFGGAGGGVNRGTGFTTIKPFDRSIQYLAAGDNLTATFTNAAGTPVTITDVTISGDCDDDTAPNTFSDLTLAGGDTTTFTCDYAAGKDAGDTFVVTVDIEYTESVAGRTITHTDSGRLTGTVE
ncbi:MAG: hypothetical protein DRO89_01135 [Candidatus Altiarchaeales archaeon]|nr:MAG: hypothetical protein DRO89_01135 [Candidatus Altiarchaeales archaeon]